MNQRLFTLAVANKNKLVLCKRSTSVNLPSKVKYNNKITNRSRWTLRPSAAISAALQIGGARIALLYVTY